MKKQLKDELNKVIDEGKYVETSDNEVLVVSGKHEVDKEIDRWHSKLNQDDLEKLEKTKEKQQENFENDEDSNPFKKSSRLNRT